MPTTRRLHPLDLLHLNLCNLDSYTENYDLNFYLTYLMRWPRLFQCVEEEEYGYHSAKPTPTLSPPPSSPSSAAKKIVAYIMGKVETQPAQQPLVANPLPWHGHITILTVSPTHRRLRYAHTLTTRLECACNAAAAWFVDLYVRASNRAAMAMYRGMGYSVFRRVVGYYAESLQEEEEDGGGRHGEGEDAFDMRKPLDRDRDRRHVRENGEEFRVRPEDVY